MTSSQTKIQTWLTCRAEVSSVALRTAAVGDAVCLVAAVAVGDTRVRITCASVVARVALAAAAVGNAMRLVAAVTMRDARV
jgi:hypothetical protein